jgi:hypothetical protein
MTRPPEPPPEGVLIEQARTDARLSVREAARRAGISEGWWRQVVKGFQSLSGGAHGTVRNVPADTIARMAGATGRITPEQMAAEGQRPDAAEEMRRASVPPPRPEQPGVLRGLPAEYAEPAQPHLRALLARVAVAEVMHPGVPLTGRDVFPDDPGGDGARAWDQLAAKGFRVLPGEGFTSDEIAAALALAWGLDRGRQGEAAAGLTRSRPGGEARPLTAAFR